MGPGIPGGSRQATADELSAMRGDAHTRRASFEAILAQVHAEHDERLRDAARELLSHGRARVVLPSATLEAQLLSFWRGSRILRIDQACVNGAGSAASSMIRFPRHDRPDSDEVVAEYLARDIANARMND
jgi:hypothetical protein